jgi:hypothetical protein
MVATRSQAKAIWPDFLVVMWVAQADAEDRNHSGAATQSMSLRGFANRGTSSGCCVRATSGYNAIAPPGVR